MSERCNILSKGTNQGKMDNKKLTIFDCEKEEADAFYELAPRFGIIPTILSTPAKCGRIPDPCHHCISIGHREHITKADLEALQKAGVTYICTRSIGYDHIDVEAAAKLGITVNNTAYSPDGVADYTIMLMLMVLRGAKKHFTSCVSWRFLPAALPRARTAGHDRGRRRRRTYRQRRHAKAFLLRLPHTDLQSQ